MHKFTKLLALQQFQFLWVSKISNQFNLHFSLSNSHYYNLKEKIQIEIEIKKKRKINHNSYSIHHHSCRKIHYSGECIGNRKAVFTSRNYHRKSCFLFLNSDLKIYDCNVNQNTNKTIAPQVRLELLNISFTFSPNLYCEMTTFWQILVPFILNTIPTC